MRIRLFLFILLSNAWLAQATENLHTAVMQNTAAQTTPLSEVDQADDELDAAGEDNQLDLSDEFANAEHHDRLTSDKTFKSLQKVMPQFATSINNQKRIEEAKQVEEENQSALDIAVMKFARMPRMRSSIVLIYDEHGKQALHSSNADVVAPIASITKLMTAMVVLDANLPLDEEITISNVDINRQKRTRSRTQVGMTLTRGELLKLALMASDNLSAAALARTYPGGTEAALVKMNAKAQELGMNSSRFMDPTGLNSNNVSTANDLVKMVSAAHSYELIHQFTTSTSHIVEREGRRPLSFHNTNPLVRNTSWDIGLSKTGYISEAGRCLVMEAKITDHPVIIVLLDSWGRNSRVGDANRVKKWMENASLRGQNARNL
jgi:D-alanyl-D-alanine endopeptidase (penicillin-binding protein 7)